MEALKTNTTIQYLIFTVSTLMKLMTLKNILIFYVNKQNNLNVGTKMILEYLLYVSMNAIKSQKTPTKPLTRKQNIY